MATIDNDKLAVLIDADNAPSSIIHELLAEVSRYGTASIKRAYGDWTTSNLKNWKDVLHKMAIQPIQQFSYTSGKNSTDSALIIDAMDLLHSGNLDGFCIVSSDSDFTRLATRIREDGLLVYGFGERKTPDPFVAACDKFIFVEILKPEGSGETKSENSLDKIEPFEPMVRNAINATAKDNGWAALSAIGSMLVKNSPSFDPRNYGCQKLGELIRKQNYLEVKETPVGDGSSNVHIHIRLKTSIKKNTSK
ncbi:NYN domain-containing protein [Arenimonas sp. GDDSR-1]|uniref:NYN domain-containing protein n=1 Tax=Arenimonas sp. GDDSR-1 TaxID=2950125 RepID=UPI00260FA292|nr:NYN domain-containing protein [Arenimonas sp. GDDSR-1]